MGLDFWKFNGDEDTSPTALSPGAVAALLARANWRAVQDESEYWELTLPTSLSLQETNSLTTLDVPYYPYRQRYYDVGKIKYNNAFNVVLYLYAQISYKLETEFRYRLSLLLMPFMTAF